MTAHGFARALRSAKRKVLKAATRRVPAHADAQTPAKRMREHGEATCGVFRGRRPHCYASAPRLFRDLPFGQPALAAA